MTPKDIFRQVRMTPEINDNAEVKYSDYQMISALNSVLSMVYNALANQNSTIINKEETLELDDYEAELPDDFLSMVSVFNASGEPLSVSGKSGSISTTTYRILGNTIYSLNEALTIEYKSWFEDVEYDTMEDDLDLPAYFGELLKKYVVVLLMGGVSSADASVMERVEADVQRLTAGKDYGFLSVSLDTSSNWAGAI